MRLAVLVLLLISSVWGRTLAETYSVSAPPRLGADEGRRLFAPLTDLLARETGESFIYVHPGSWFAYQRDIRKGRFDLLLDDAHLASWRMAVLGQVPVVRARNPVTFVVIAVKDGKIYSREDLIGRPVCAYPPPDLGTVGFLRKFDGPFQIPLISATSNPLDRVKRLLAGECAGAILARHPYFESEEIRSVSPQLEIVTQTDSYPGLTLTAAADLPDNLRDALQHILLSRAGEKATSDLRNRLSDGSSFVPAHSEEYIGLDDLLRGYPGFGGP